MANLANTLTQSLRARYPNNFDKNELRESRYGAWEFFQTDTRSPDTIFTPEIMSLIPGSFGNSVVIPVLDAETVTIGNIRSCTIPDSENTSQLITLTFVTYAFAFTMYPAQHFNNDVKRQADYDRKLRKYLIQMASDLDQRAILTLENGKNQHWTNVAPDYYAEIGDALQVAQAEKNDFFNNADAIMRTMDFYGDPNIIASTSLQPMVRRLDNQGSNNAVNESFQLSPYTWWHSNRIANSMGIQSTGFLVQQGSVATANRNDPDAILGHSVGTQMEWGEVVMPIVNLKMGSFYREDCGDASNLHAGTTGLTRTKKEGFEFSTDVCFQTVYNSDIANRYNPIVKFQISTT